MLNSWFLIWFGLNITVTLLNKTFFSTLRAPYPAAVTFVHMAVSGVAAAATLALFRERYRVSPIKGRQHSRIMAMSVLFAANVVVGNASLNYCSIAFVQMVRCTIPAVTAMLSFVILGSRVSNRVAMTLIPIVVGAAVVCYGEVRLTGFGLLLTVLGCALSAFKTVLTKVFLSGADSVHPFQLLEAVSLLGAVELLPVIELTEPDFLREWVPAQSAPVLFLLFVHGCFAFMLNVSNFEANKCTSPLLITIGGNVKSVVTVFLSILLFNAPISPTFVVGSLITFAGVWAYGNEKLREQSAQQHHRGGAAGRGGPLLPLTAAKGSRGQIAVSGRSLHV